MWYKLLEKAKKPFQDNADLSKSKYREQKIPLLKQRRIHQELQLETQISARNSKKEFEKYKRKVENSKKKKTNVTLFCNLMQYYYFCFVGFYGSVWLYIGKNKNTNRNNYYETYFFI